MNNDFLLKLYNESSTYSPLSSGHIEFEDRIILFARNIDSIKVKICFNITKSDLEIEISIDSLHKYLKNKGLI